MVEQPLRMHDSPRAFSAGASVCIVNSEQLSAVLAVNQRLLLRPREPFNCCFALHGLALRVEHFAVRQRHRTASARIFRTFSAVVRRQPSREVVRPAAVQRIIRTAEHISISTHRLALISRCARIVQPRFLICRRTFALLFSLFPLPETSITSTSVPGGSSSTALLNTGAG